MNKNLTVQQKAVLFAVMTDAWESLRRLETGVARLCNRKDVSLYFRLVYGRPTRRAFPILFCEPTKTLAKYLKATRTLESKHRCVKRSAVTKRA